MHELDQTKVKAFSAKMLGILNGGMLALMTSIGHQTGLFEIMADLSPSTSEQIATAAGLKERYVREWLAAMVTGCIIEYDPMSNAYSLPPEHATLLTQVAGPENMAGFAQLIPILAAVEEGIVESFRKGGGVPYDAYSRFMEFWAENTSQRFDKTLISEVLPLIPETVEALKRGIDVLEVGCGRGHALNLMAKAFPESKFTGYDFLEEAIAVASTEAESLRLSNVHFEAKDVVTLGESDKYGLITAFDVIHDLAQPTKVLKAIAEALRHDGTFLMVDIAASSHLHENLDHPMAPWLYATSCMHCMTVSLALDGAGLGTMWGEQKARLMLANAGFTDVDVQQIPWDIFNNYYIATKNSTT